MTDRPSNVWQSVVVSECTETQVGQVEDGEPARGSGLDDSGLTLSEDHRSTDGTEKSDSDTEQPEFLFPVCLHIQCLSILLYPKHF